MRNSSFYNIIQSLIDTLFPPHPEVKLLRDLKSADILKLLSERQPEKPFIRAICDYREKAAKAVVWAGKYHSSRTAVRLMAEIILEELLQICAEERIFADKIAITPVPISKKRKKKRGFNQAERIAAAIEDSDKSETFYTLDVLDKARDTTHQTELSKVAREKNLIHSCCVKPGVKLDDIEVIIVVDDVTTTGATLEEARRALGEKTDAKVIGVAFAH